MRNTYGAGHRGLPLQRAVVDPSVLVSAFIGDREAWPGRLITAWRDRRFVLVVSPLLVDELVDVLGRPKFERCFSQGRASAYIAAPPRYALRRA